MFFFRECPSAQELHLFDGYAYKNLLIYGFHKENSFYIYSIVLNILLK